MSAKPQPMSVDQFEDKHSRDLDEALEDNVQQAKCFSLTCFVGSDSS